MRLPVIQLATNPIDHARLMILPFAALQLAIVWVLAHYASSLRSWGWGKPGRRALLLLVFGTATILPVVAQLVIVGPGATQDNFVFAVITGECVISLVYVVHLQKRLRSGSQ